MDGMGIFGFNRMTSRHEFVWMDSFGTMMMFGTGEADESGKVITYLTEMTGPDGSTIDMKMVTNMKDDNHHVVDMYIQTPDGGWFKTMQIDSTR